MRRSRQSPNRTNVAVSRAKHGMYILGNADQLASSSSAMWRSIVTELEKTDTIGPALPIACYRHQEVKLIDTPGQLEREAPDGELIHMLTVNDRRLSSTL